MLFKITAWKACWLSPLLCVVITQKAAIATLPLTTHPQWAELYTFTSFIVMCCINNNNNNNNNNNKKKKKKKKNKCSINKRTGKFKMRLAGKQG